MECEFLYDQNTYRVKVEEMPGGLRVTVEGRVFEIDARTLSEGLLSLVIGGRSVLAHTARDAHSRFVCIGGVTYALHYPSEDFKAGAGLARAGDGVILTPMPGKIVAVHVKPGDAVEKDQPLLVLESMKMQNEILSDVKGVVKKMHFSPGDRAQYGDPLVEIEVKSDSASPGAP